jgi:hypothetical protein
MGGGEGLVGVLRGDEQAVLLKEQHRGHTAVLAPVLLYERAHPLRQVIARMRVRHPQRRRLVREEVVELGAALLRADVRIHRHRMQMNHAAAEQRMQMRLDRGARLGRGFVIAAGLEMTDDGALAPRRIQCGHVRVVEQGQHAAELQPPPAACLRHVLQRGAARFDIEVLPIFGLDGGVAAAALDQGRSPHLARNANEIASAWSISFLSSRPVPASRLRRGATAPPPRRAAQPHQPHQTEVAARWIEITLPGYGSASISRMPAIAPPCPTPRQPRDWYRDGRR